MFSPRIGAASRSSRLPWCGRDGTSISEERANLAAGAAINGPQGVSFTASPGGTAFPTSFAPISGFPPGVALPARDVTILAGQCSYLNGFLPVNQLRFCPNTFYNPYTQQWNLGVEHDFGKGWLFSMDYIGSHTTHIEQPVDMNYPSAFDRENAARDGRTQLGGDNVHGGAASIGCLAMVVANFGSAITTGYR
jgi:hypothetical protein